MLGKRLRGVRTIQNRGDSPVTIWLEPYCEETELPAGSTATLRHNGDPKTEEITELSEDRMTIWCTGDRFSLEVDGKVMASR